MVEEKVEILVETECRPLRKFHNLNYFMFKDIIYPNSSTVQHRIDGLSCTFARNEFFTMTQPQSKPAPKRRLITEFFAVKKVKSEDSKPEVTRDNYLSNQASSETIAPQNSLSDEKETLTEETRPKSTPEGEKNLVKDEFAAKNGFNKDVWVQSLTAEEKELLQLEIETLDITWLTFLHKTLTKPYFLKLKRFLKLQQGKTVFPPAKDIYSWSRLTPLPNVRCLILGQDPYHNFNQAHGLAFSVLEPTRPPPSLVNIYKTLAIDYPDSFKTPDYKRTSGGGNLTKWAERGVLMLNTCLTVEAHKANSHAKQGWEEFTGEVLQTAFNYHTKKGGFVVMAWGSPAQKRIQSLKFDTNSYLVLKTVHPLPLSASRGFFHAEVFKKCNEWLQKKGKKRIDWGVVEGNVVV